MNFKREDCFEEFEKGKFSWFSYRFKIYDGILSLESYIILWNDIISRNSWIEQ